MGKCVSLSELAITVELINFISHASLNEKWRKNDQNCQSLRWFLKSDGFHCITKQLFPCRKKMRGNNKGNKTGTQHNMKDWIVGFCNLPKHFWFLAARISTFSPASLWQAISIKWASSDLFLKWTSVVQLLCLKKNSNECAERELNQQSLEALKLLERSKT